jgi:hypothetical protein
MSSAGQRSEHASVHRLKNHLSIIITFCELLLETAESDDPRRGDVVMIRQAAQAAMAIVPTLAAKSA